MNTFADYTTRSIQQNPAQAAESMLRQLWDGQFPVDPFMIARKAGLQVVFLNPFTEAGLSGRFDAEQRVIGVSQIEAPVRQRFTAAHELGHYALNHGSKFRDSAVSFSSRVADPKEREANQFAAALLMPAYAVRQVVGSGLYRSVDEIASVFGVSKVAMGFRISNLQLGLVR